MGGKDKRWQKVKNYKDIDIGGVSSKWNCKFSAWVYMIIRAILYIAMQVAADLDEGLGITKRIKEPMPINKPEQNKGV